jgi:hypothetical protein
LVAFLLLLGLGAFTAAEAGVIPSKAQTAQAEADRAQVQSLLGRSEVAQALSARGLSPQEIEGRLAELSADDLRSLAANLDQVQAAGDVPGYIWILVAIILALVIIGAIANAD